MKLLIIAPERHPVPSTRGTSVETCIYNIAKQLAIEHMVTIISVVKGNLPKKTFEGNLQILRVPGGKKESYLKEVANVVKGEKFDFIQIDNRPEFLPEIRKLFPWAPISLFLHSLTFVTPPKTTISIAHSQLDKADLIISNSESLKKELSHLFPDQCKKIKVIHLGVNLIEFRPPTKIERTKIRSKYLADHKFVIVYAGRFIPLKGIPTLIKSVYVVRKKIPNAELFLAGRGSKKYTSYIKRKARKLKVPVHFMGAIPVKDMPQVYWLADCFICPTQGHEAFGLVVVESLACGVPTIASKTGGIPEIIKHRQTGLLISNYQRHHAFAKAIMEVYRNKTLAQKLSLNGRKDCLLKFSWEATSSNLSALYAHELDKKLA
jgi:spore coat protein SA